MPDENPRAARPRKLDPYQALGIRVTSEIPYELEEDVDAAGIQNVEFIQLQGADEFPPVNYPNLTDAENAALEARLGPAKTVGRLGCDGTTPSTRALARCRPSVPRRTLPRISSITSPMQRGTASRRRMEKCCSSPRFADPHRWRRKGEPRTKTRQTHFAVCYSGPSSR